jgi:hypothetical protein
LGGLLPFTYQLSNMSSNEISDVSRLSQPLPAELPTNLQQFLQANLYSRDTLPLQNFSDRAPATSSDVSRMLSGFSVGGTSARPTLEAQPVSSTKSASDAQPASSAKQVAEAQPATEQTQVVNKQTGGDVGGDPRPIQQAPKEVYPIATGPLTPGGDPQPIQQAPKEVYPIATGPLTPGGDPQPIHQAPKEAHPIGTGPLTPGGDPQPIQQAPKEVYPIATGPLTPGGDTQPIQSNPTEIGKDVVLGGEMSSAPSGESPLASNQFAQEAKEVLAKLDPFGVGVTKDELAKALQDPSFTGQEAQALAALYYNFDSLQDMSRHYTGEQADVRAPRTITPADLDTYQSELTAGKADSNLVNSINGVTYRVATAAEQFSDATSLYTTQNPLDSINPSAIIQGFTGDCYFEAPLAAVAATNPQLIENAIKDNHNGTYTVTFPGDPTHPVTVAAPTEAEMGLYNGGSPNGEWATVMEKAFGQYLENNNLLDKLFGSNNPEETAGGGGLASTAMQLLTGKEASTDMLLFHSQADVASQLEAAFSKNPPAAVSAGIGNLWFGLFGDNTENGFPTDHEYTILGYNPNGPDGGTITIRNPWGQGDGTSGLTQISLDQFMKNFSDITVEDPDSPYPPPPTNNPYV